MGLRQGCLLSPSLFCLFINDLESKLGGGCKLGNRLIRILCFADDLVLLSNSPTTLQLMINRLEKYCADWNLKVNEQKSKIVVFKNGGKLASDEKWLFEKKPIAVENSYKYLGINLTTKLSFEQHFKEKLTVAKFGINSTWKHVVSHSNISINSKYKLFDAVARSIMGYAAPIWAGKKYETVEKLQYYFLKKILLLPRNTPSYFLLLETGKDPLFLFYLKQQIDYIRKIVEMPEQRLPKILTKLLIKEKEFWIKDWKGLAEKYSFNFDFNEIDQWLNNIKLANSALSSFYENIKMGIRAELHSRVSQSSYHETYKWLNFDSESVNYMYIKQLSAPNISLICKVRGSVLKLNYTPWASDKDYKCAMCSTGEDETLHHFLTSCPAYRQFRKQFLGEETITAERAKCIINGEDWFGLAFFINSAYKYRKNKLN